MGRTAVKMHCFSLYPVGPIPTVRFWPCDASYAADSPPAATATGAVIFCVALRLKNYWFSYFELFAQYILQNDCLFNDECFAVCCTEIRARSRKLQPKIRFATDFSSLLNGMQSRDSSLSYHRI